MDVGISPVTVVKLALGVVLWAVLYYGLTSAGVSGGLAGAVSAGGSLLLVSVVFEELGVFDLADR